MLYTYLLHTGNAKWKIQGKTGKIICTWFLFFCDWDEYVLLSVVMYDKVCIGRGNPVGVCADEGIPHKAFVTLMQRYKIKDFCNVLKVLFTHFGPNTLYHKWLQVGVWQLNIVYHLEYGNQHREWTVGKYCK